MEPENVDEFIRWFNAELSRLNLTDYQFAKKAGITHPIISKARKGNMPGWDSLVKIAIALQADPVVVLRLAGRLPKRPERNIERDNLIFLCEKLNEEYVPVVAKMVRALSEE